MNTLRGIQDSPRSPTRSNRAKLKGGRRNSHGLTRTIAAGTLEELGRTSKGSKMKRRSLNQLDLAAFNRIEAEEGHINQSIDERSAASSPMVRKRGSQINIDPAINRPRATIKSKTTVFKVITNISKSASKEVNIVISHSKAVSDVTILFPFSAPHNFIYIK